VSRCDPVPVRRRVNFHEIKKSTLAGRGAALPSGWARMEARRQSGLKRVAALHDSDLADAAASRRLPSTLQADETAVA
jgi:hypothetical protein